MAVSTSLSPLSRTDDLPTGSGTPERPIAGSLTEKSRTTLHRAEKAMDTIKTWKSAVSVIRRVMDIGGPIAAVCPVSFLPIRPELISAAQLNPYASLAWSILSQIPEVRPLVLIWHIHCFCSPCLPTLLKLVATDENVQALLEAIRDTFELTEEADTLRNIQPESKQAKSIHEMLECVSQSAEFIESYAKDVQVGMSS
jgi:hypothetical protein